MAAQMWSTQLDSGSTPPLDAAPRIALLEIAGAYAALLRRPTTAALFRVIIAEAERFPELGAALYTKGKRPYLDRLEHFLCESPALQVPAGEASMAARELLGMINDQLFWPGLLIADFQVDDAHADAVCSSAVATFLARYAG